jgi:hypothetical protein
MSDHDTLARQCLRYIRGALTDEQYQEAHGLITAALQDRFDLGFKAAGGSIVDLHVMPNTMMEVARDTHLASLVAARDYIIDKYIFESLSPGELATAVVAEGILKTVIEEKLSLMRQS